MSQAKPDKYKRLSFWEWLILSVTQFLCLGVVNWSPAFAPDSLLLGLLVNLLFLPVIWKPLSGPAWVVGRSAFLAYLALVFWDMGNLVRYQAALPLVGRFLFGIWPTLLMGWLTTRRSS